MATLGDSRERVDSYGREQAEIEAKRADAAEQENAKLKALLREHGIQ